MIDLQVIDIAHKEQSSGNMIDEVRKKYIKDQKPEVPDDNFKVV